MFQANLNAVQFSKKKLYLMVVVPLSKTLTNLFFRPKRAIICIQFSQNSALLDCLVPLIIH